MPDNSSETEKLRLLEKLWNWLVAGPNLESWISICFWIFVLLIILILTIAVLSWAIGTGSEGIAKVLEAYKKSGLPLTLGKAKKAQIRRRQQFCKVLNGDLLSLAKSENWNDQYFTDLEAEVEAEGRYYASALDKLLGRQSQGLRKVSSLISAIELSTEQALLIVGQPGSGKSVALRHLAHQFAERGIHSADPETLIPLYLNLKELTTNSDETINADVIKQFVLDNIRRGDADTAAYVHQHWDEYRDRGIWFFLFDSFDEIPAVLHAPTESTVIRQHAEAIRQFLGGMSNCRGILASREYKGPNALPWQKIRILPLSEERQEQLIENSFLEPRQKEIVRLHMASNKSNLRNNPLFLTLLCRYVKDKNKPPINDHDLLSGHIDRLAKRDEDYVLRKYGLTSSQLIEGAIQLAVLFAENQNLSLAPTQSEIAAAVNNESIPGGNLENMLGALVDVKIGRSDVREARAGDRRFTFSHRRYQETLFVRHLARTSKYLTPRELLTDTKWREYTVTLLQTQELEIIVPLIKEAAVLISEYEKQSKRVPIIKEFGGNLSYYDWTNDPAVPLLSILQEGLEKRLNNIPEILFNKVQKFLYPRWLEGDGYDQIMVLKYGELLPDNFLCSIITFAVNHGGSIMEGIAFQKIVFLSNIPEVFITWIQNKLSIEVIEARKMSDIHRLEALAARLPKSIGADYIVRRCKLFNKLSRTFNKFSFFVDANLLIFKFLHKFLFENGFNKNKSLDLDNKPIYFDFIFLLLFMPIFITLYIFGDIYKEIKNKISLDIIESIEQTFNLITESSNFKLYEYFAIFYLLEIILIFLFFRVRSVGQRIDFQYFLMSFQQINLFGFIISKLFKIFLFILSVAIFVMAPGFVSQKLLLFFDFDIKNTFFLYIGTFLLLFFVINIAAYISENFKLKRLKSRLELLKNTESNNSFFLQAKSTYELNYWLNNVTLNDNVIRSIMRLLKSIPKYQENHFIYSSPLFKIDIDLDAINNTLNILMNLKANKYLNEQVARNLIQI